MVQKKTKEEVRLAGDLFILGLVMMAGLLFVVKFTDFLIVTLCLRAIGAVGVYVGVPLMRFFGPVFRWVIFPVYDTVMMGIAWLWRLGGGGLKGWGLVLTVICLICVMGVRAIFWLERAWIDRKQKHKPTSEVGS